MSGQLVGYTRVSSLDQNVERQLDGIALDRTFTDSASGRNTVRPQLEAMLAFVRDGDTVIVHSMDRLARNLDDLRALVKTLTGRGVRVQFVKEGFETVPKPATTAVTCSGSWRASGRAMWRHPLHQARLEDLVR